MPQPFPGRRHEVTRLEGFSDAVFAFAVTLLVVSLEVPRTFDELVAAMRGFLAFAICFALLFQVWWRHNVYFRRYGLEDAASKTLTGILLFVVLFYVYPLKFLWTLVVNGLVFHVNTVTRPGGAVEEMIAAAQVPQLFEIYGIGAAAVFAIFAGLYGHAYRLRRELGLTPLETLETRLSILSGAGISLIGLMSAGVAWLGGRVERHWLIQLAGYIYFAIGLVEWGIGEYGGRQQRKLGA